MNLIYLLLLGFAVSMDAFAAGAAYGIKSIKMPARSLATVGLITALFTSLAMALAHYASSFMNDNIAVVGGSLILIGIGVFNVLKEYLSNPSFALCLGKEFKFRVGQLVINIMIDPQKADLDDSKSISPSESVFLGLALGIDNMAATFGAAMINMLPLYTPLVMALLQVFLLAAGLQASARFLPDKIKDKFTYVPGTILIVLGVFRLI